MTARIQCGKIETRRGMIEICTMEPDHEGVCLHHVPPGLRELYEKADEAELDEEWH